MDADYVLGEIAVAEFVSSYCVVDEHTDDRVYTDIFMVGGTEYTIIEHDYEMSFRGFFLHLIGPELEIKTTHADVQHSIPEVEFMRGTQEDLDSFCLMFAIQYPGVFREDDHRRRNDRF